MPDGSGRSALVFVGGLLLTGSVTIASGYNLIVAALGILGSLVLALHEAVSPSVPPSSRVQSVSYSKWVWLTAAVALSTLTLVPILAAYSPTVVSQVPPAGGGPAPSSQVTCPNPCVISIQNSIFGSSAQVKNGNGYVVVAVGTKVIWQNNDNTQHTTTSVDGIWDSNILNPGQSFSFTFTQTGTFNYICNVHPMTGTVVVVSG
jgi:hypothetical protein